MFLDMADTLKYNKNQALKKFLKPETRNEISTELAT